MPGGIGGWSWSPDPGVDELIEILMADPDIKPYIFVKLQVLKNKRQAMMEQPAKDE